MYPRKVFSAYKLLSALFGLYPAMLESASCIILFNFMINTFSSFLERMPCAHMIFDALIEKDGSFRYERMAHKGTKRHILA